MSTRVLITLKNGKVIQGVNYRMDPNSAPTPWVPQSPVPFNGGYYHIETANGWVYNIGVDDIQSISVARQAST